MHSLDGNIMIGWNLEKISLFCACMLRMKLESKTFQHLAAASAYIYIIVAFWADLTNA